MKKVGVLVLGLSTFGVTASAQEPDASPSQGLEIGFRLGFAIASGNEGTTPGGNFGNLTDDVSGMIPLIVDGGYHFKNVYLGLSFQYAFGVFSTDYCSASGSSCSASDSRLDLNLHYRLSPGKDLDPWVGLGVGYEWLTLKDVAGSQSGDRRASGFELANLQFGGDFQVSPNLGIGPFFSLSFGQYQKLSVSGPDSLYNADVIGKEIHEWITIGVRGIYDVRARAAMAPSPLQ